MSIVLVTGFEPFHKASANPSQAIVEELRNAGIAGLHFQILPVIFGESSRKLISTIEELRPNIVISLGQAEGRKEITPERVAINLEDARIEDNAGHQPKNVPINVEGPAQFESTLPIDEIVSELQSVGIPATPSESAGTFVCNHLFYKLQQFTCTREIKSGLIHVPLMESQTPEFQGLPTMKLETMVRAISIAIEVSRS